ncbi:MAG TPA: glycosyltransferase family 2 protein [Allosphingosinicella sp.]|uniref:glycosyltransferase family 2 protein n=1 Tax=Allosphingosinicella sp. TaxID=2823234 RepID=UPI002F279278
MNRDCAAVIPALNEEATISHVVSVARQQLDRIVVVDDGSDDRTGEVAAKAGATVLRNSHTAGQGRSITRGLGWAIANGAHHVVILDADGAHDPLRIGNLLRDHLSSGADLTIGSRFLGSTKLPSPKRSANRFATTLLNRMFGFEVSDAASGFRAVSGRVARLVFARTDFAFAFEMIRCCRLHSLIIQEVPAEAHYNAAELHCTNQAELLCLLDFCSSTPNAAAQGAELCVEAAERVRRWQGFAARIGSARFFFHPLRSYNGYAIQEQDGYFDTWVAVDAAALPLMIDL